MTSCRSRRSLLFIWMTALLLSSLVVSHGQVQADEEGTTHLVVATPTEVPLSNTARVMAFLTDELGAPIPEAEVVFTMPASFAGAVNEMEVARVMTDAEGQAVIDYQLRIEGENQFIGRFYGDEVHAPAEGKSVVVATGFAQLSERSAGVEVPFLGAWTLAAVVGSVWVVYMIVMWLVAQIPESREEAEREA